MGTIGERIERLERSNPDPPETLRVTIRRPDRRVNGEPAPTAHVVEVPHGGGPTRD